MPDDDRRKEQRAMTTAIERLRAALVDGEWTAEERRADALRALAEIEAEWERLFAPVDVDAEVEASIPAHVTTASLRAGYAAALRSPVEQRARLQREVERFSEQWKAAVAAGEKIAQDYRAQRDEARREVEGLKSDLDSLARDVGQALVAATLRPGERLTEQRPHAIVRTVVRLVARPTEVRAVPTPEMAVTTGEEPPDSVDPREPRTGPTREARRPVLLFSPHRGGTDGTSPAGSRNGSGRNGTTEQAGRQRDGAP